MAAFIYTYKSWDAVRPILLPKTGFGAQLKLYEKSKKLLQRNDPTIISQYLTVLELLEKVEAERKKVIKTCGTNASYKAAKAALEKADLKVEKSALKKKLSGIVGELFDNIDQAADARKAWMAGEIKLLEDVLKAYKAGKPLSAKQRNLVSSRYNSGLNAYDAAIDKPDDTPLAVLGSVLSEKSQLSKEAPGVVKRAEDLEHLLKDARAQSKERGDVWKKVYPYVDKEAKG